jgi:hypothetical protein
MPPQTNKLGLECFTGRLSLVKTTSTRKEDDVLRVCTAFQEQ